MAKLLRAVDALFFVVVNAITCNLIKGSKLIVHILGDVFRVVAVNAHGDEQVVVGVIRWWGVFDARHREALCQTNNSAQLSLHQ